MSIKEIKTLLYDMRIRMWKSKKPFRLLSPFFFLMKVNNNKIVFENMSGIGYGGDPKYIAQYIIENNLPFELVWLYNRHNKNGIDVSGIRFVDMYSFKGLIEQATAKFWVSNSRKLIYPPKKKQQIYFQTWHGIFPSKYIEKDAESTLNPGYIKAAKKDSAITDYMVSGCKYRTKLFRESFYYTGEILEIGTPKDDVFFNKREIEKKKTLISEEYHLNGKTIVLYAPTFRNDKRLDVYNLDYKKVSLAFKKLTNRECAILVRLHPNMSSYSDKLDLPSDILNVTSYPDMQDLLCAADFIITDYSSSLDYSFFYKPVFLYCPDLEQYLRLERNMYIKMEELPFPIATTSEEFVENVISFNYESYKKKLSISYERYGLAEYGTACKAIVDMMCEETGIIQKQ